MSILRRFARYLRPYPQFIVILVIALLGGVAAELILPKLLGLIIDRGIAARSMPIVIRYTGLVVLVTLGRAAGHYFQGYSQERLGQELIRALRHDLYVKLQRLSFTYYTVHATGDQMSRLTTDLGALAEFFSYGFSESIMCILMFVGTLAVLLSADWQLALVIAIPIPVLMLIAFRFSGVVGPAWEKIRAEMGRLSTTLQENISGVRVVKSFSRESHEMRKFGGRNTSNLQANIVRADIESRTFPMMNLITGISFFLMLWYGSRRVISGDITLGTFFAVNWLIWGLIWPVRFLGYLISVARKAIAAGPRVFAILDSDMEVPSSPDAPDLAHITGHLEFKDVAFAFSDGDGTPVLQGFNLEAQPGQIVAVLGGTGSGKSSVINLIPRFYDPQSGSITVDGIDIRTVNLPSLRRQIGIVPQETFLFSDTVRNNIAFGRPDATPEEIEAAAVAAQAHEFIAKLPKGYDTRVGERGVGLSGGQKQRIAIARALLLDPRLLILDEATSSVDAETEHALQLALDRLMEGRTSIIIAQRLSTVKNASKVVVLKDGAVVEEGTHEELLRKDGEYTMIYNLQLRPAEELV
ncbi:MAG: ABC transporter ATP-binding protein [Anaerolineae bacterium]